jgi:uncharacterized protein (TIGR02246 family)
MKPIFILPLAISLLCGACTQTRKPAYDSKADKDAIRSVLATEQIAWNNADLEAFMEGFWKSDSLLFMSPGGVAHGWQETLENYKRRYPDRAAMGTLSYEILQVDLLSRGVFLVAGRYHITLSNGTADGSFSVIFKKKDGKWVAIYDHIS